MKNKILIIKRIAALLLLITLMGPLIPIRVFGSSIGNIESFSEEGNTLIFNSGITQVRLDLCTERSVRIRLSRNKDEGYRPADPEYYMVQKEIWEVVPRTLSDEGDYYSVKTAALEVRIQKEPLRIGMYDLDGSLISRDTDETGIYWNGNTVGVRKEENQENAGGIFGFGSGDHGRRTNLNRYNQDFHEFTMSHGLVVAPFFMSTVGYGIFLNTIEENTVFYKQGTGFQTEGYLDYFFMYGPDFKTIQNEYAEITGRMELYGKWAHGFMLSKYGNDNATQAEFLEWINRFRDEGYPLDSYVFDYGWRGDVNDNGGNQTGAGEKWGKQMWSNDITKFPDLQAMFEEARALGIHVGLHNNAGTPEANGGDKLYLEEYEDIWVKSYLEIIKSGYGSWFWPDEFDVLGSNSAPVLSSKAAYDAWKEYTTSSRPMFITRGSYAGHHYATAWSGDINNTSQELINQIGFSLDAGLIGYWASSHDLGGFMKKPSDELYTRWVAEFGAWNGIMRTHGHNGREPWLYNELAQETLKNNLKTRYKLYPYIYNMAWQGYSQGIPMMRAMILEDDSQYNPDAWDLNQQYYFGDWFLVAPAADAADTVVSVWLPPETTWYNYYTGARYEGGSSGKTITVSAALEEIPVFVKAGAIIPMGPDLDYADEVPLNPLTLDIYPSGTTTYTLYEDDGQSRNYLTLDAYSTTKYTSIEDGNDIRFIISEREDHNPEYYQVEARSYNLKFNHLDAVHGITLNGKSLSSASSIVEYNNLEEAYYFDEEAKVVYVKAVDTGEEIIVAIASNGIAEPELGEESQGLPPKRIESGDVFELEYANFLPVAEGEVTFDDEWKGYTGEGFAKGFKKAGDSLEFSVNIAREGIYTLTLRVNNGKKGDPVYDDLPRTGALYIDDEKHADLAFLVTPTWGDSNKNGVWVNYKIEDVLLDAGIYNFKIVSEGENPGNYNLDSMKFERSDTSLDAFSIIKAEKASLLSEVSKVDDADFSYLYSNLGGSWVRFSEVRGKNKGGISLRLKSSTGGSIIVYENGVGDKILATIALPDNDEWLEFEVDTRDTDAIESDIYFEFIALPDSNLEVSLEWFKFIKKVDAYQKMPAYLADKREGINIRDNKLVNIYDGSWFRFEGFDFKEGGVKSVLVNAATQRAGGKINIYIDDISPANKIGEVLITTTGSWSNFQRFIGEIEDVKGVHDVYFQFETSSKDAICDLQDLQFTTKTITVITEVIGEDVSIQVSDDMAISGSNVIFQILGLKEDSVIEILSITDYLGNALEYNQVNDNRYSFTMPEIFPVKISLTVTRQPLIIESGTIFELEEGCGITNDSNTGLRVDSEWPGFTGRGYVAGWKNVGNYVEIKAIIKETGTYSLILRYGAGPKNETVYNMSPRTGALYLNDNKIQDFGLEVMDNWGIWSNYTFDQVYLEAGELTIKIVALGSDNPGNFNLDSLRFINLNIVDKSKLEILIDEVEQLKKDNYTTASWQLVEENLRDALIVLNDDSKTKAEVEKAYYDLLSSKENLEEKIIRTKFELHSLIADLMSLNQEDYTGDSWEELELLIEEGLNLYNDKDSSSENINQLYEDLLNARNNLEEMPDAPKGSIWWVWTLLAFLVFSILGVLVFLKLKKHK